MDKKPYTVLMVVPDYLADQYGEDTYLAHINADDIDDAKVGGQHVAANSYADHDFEGDRPEPTDFHVAFVCRGHVNDIKDGETAAEQEKEEWPGSIPVDHHPV